MPEHEPETEPAPADAARRRPTPLDLRSPDPVRDRRDRLLRLFPEARTEGDGIDFDRLRELLGDRIDDADERYGLCWPGRAECLRLVHRRSDATLRPRKDLSVDFDRTRNLFVDGDNLEVLKLLAASHHNRVKVIYVDPPYNTGNDFVYRDDFAEPLRAWLRFTGQVDDDGRVFTSNPETDGRFHSRWLDLVWPRLWLARDLLRRDGVIFVSIDDRELANLRRVLDDVFGEENFVGCVTRIAKKTSNKGTHFAPSKDYVVAYAKSIADLPPLMADVDADYAARFAHADERGRYATVALYQAALDPRPNQRYWIRCPDGSLAIPPGETLPAEASDGAMALPASARDRVWRWSRDTYERRRADLVFKATRTSPLVTPTGERSRFNVYTKYWLADRLRDGTRPRDVLDGATNDRGTADLKALGLDDAFPFAKPVALIEMLLRWVDCRDAVVLDFFAGSGTTAEAVLRQNARDGGTRRFVLVQLPEPTGRADLPTIADLARERIRRAAATLPADGGHDLGFRALQLATSCFRPWRTDACDDAAALRRRLESHLDAVLPDRGELDLLFEIALKSGVDPAAPIAPVDVAGAPAVAMDGAELLVCLHEPLTDAVFAAIAARRPRRVVCRDRAFGGDESLRARAAQRLHAAGVVAFETT